MAKKRNELSHYPHFFFSKLIFRTVSWTVFSFLFIFLGKKYVDIDIVGKICQLFGKNWKFNQYFLGAAEREKFKLLNYAIYFLIIIITVNIISLVLNRYLWKKDKYIENNNFYLHDKRIFILNSLNHIACAVLLILSFASAFTVILALLFITFNTWDLFPHQKGLRNPQLENFFSWKNQYVRKILLYSAIVFLVVPLVIGRLRSFYESATSEAPTGLAQSFRNALNTSPLLKQIVEMLKGDDFSLDLLYWFILSWFIIKNLIGGRWKEFGDFWTKINNVKKPVNNFKHYYYYQESWALANNTPINLGDYGYLENSPNFLSRSYLEGDLNINDFANKNQKVVKYIELCEERVKEPPKRDFLNYCLFNEFSSWEDCLRTKRLIRTMRKK